MRANLSRLTIKVMRTWSRRGGRLLGLGVVAVIALATGAAASSNRVGREACVPSELRAWAGLQGTTGSALGGIWVANEAASVCVLPSTPRVSLLWRGRRLAVRQLLFPRSWLDSEYPHGSERVRLLLPGKTTFVVLQWWNWCGPRPWGGGYFPGRVELRLPGKSGKVVAPLHETGAPYCNAPPSTLRVSGFLQAP